MTQMSRLGLTFVVAVVGSSAGFSQVATPPPLRGWGQIVDPNRDCQIRQDGRRLTIGIPAKTHDLNPEAGGMNAPRVLRDIEGDFIAQVKVSGKLRPAENQTVERFFPYQGAGLLLWQDARNYVRLERAAIHRQDGIIQYANFEMRKDGELLGSPSVQLPDEDLYLRIERRGDRICGAISPDGDTWHYLKPIPGTFARRVKVGVIAVNTSTDRFNPVFQELEIYKKQADQGP